MKKIFVSVFIAFSTSFLVVAKGQNPESKGKLIFESNCVRCHGSDGTKGMFGAKNLRKSTKDSTALFTIISNGKGLMPRWKKKLSESQIQEVMAYIQQLRKL